MSLKEGEVDKGSEEIVEMYCEVCKKKGKNRSADGFCVNCVRYFCDKCMSYHSEFLPDHVHKDKNTMPQDVCINPCPGHADEIIKFYCSSCNLFFCSICKKNLHSDCTGVNHIPEMVRQLEHTEMFKEFTHDLEEVISEINDKESVIEFEKESIEEMSSMALSAIDSTRRRFNKLVDDRAEALKMEVKSITDDYKEKTEKHSNRITAIKSQVGIIKSKKEQRERDKKRCELFMLMKDEGNNKSLKNELRQLKESKNIKYVFQHSTEDELFLKKTFTFGRVVFGERTVSPELQDNGIAENENEQIEIPKRRLPQGEFPDVETQKTFIASQLQRPFIKGEIWYVLDVKWFKQWKRYVGYESWDHYYVGEESAHPGPIDNTPILQEGTVKMKEHLIDDLDYALVTEEGWEKLLSWYDMLNEQKPIVRRVIEEGVYEKSLKVEVYLWYLRLCEYSNMNHQISKQVSRSDTIGRLEEIMRKEFSIPAEKDVRIWNRYMTKMYEQLKRKDVTLQDAGLYQGQEIVIEQKNIDGTWPKDN